MHDVDPAKVRRAEAVFGVPKEIEVCQEILPWEMDLIERVCGDARFHDATVFTVCSDRLALIHKPDDPPGAFWAVTGGLEPGEELADAVEREAYEETGLAVRPLRYLLRLAVLFTSGERRRPWTSHVFVAAPRSVPAPACRQGEAAGREDLPALRPVDLREVQTAEWITLDRFRQEVVPILWASGWGRFRYRLVLSRRLFREMGWTEWEPPG